MENQVQQITPSAPVREIGVITSEIKDICRQAQSMALMYAVEIGRRLVEAKEVLPHGEWGNWLKNEVDFSQRSANNFMKLFEEYGSSQLTFFSFNSNSQTFANLPYSKALALLSVPADEREEFAEEVKVDEISLIELKNAIEGRKEAERLAQEAAEREQELSQKLASAEIAKVAAEKRAAEVDKAREQVAKLEADLEKRKKSEAKLKDKLKAAETNPKIPDETLAKIKADAEAEIKAAQGSEIERQIKEAKADVAADIENLQKQLDEARIALDVAEQAKAQAEANAKDSLEKLNDAQKKLKLANPKVTLFKKLFEDLQETYAKLQVFYHEIVDESPDLAKGLQAALYSFKDSIK